MATIAINAYQNLTMPEWATDPDRCLSFPDNMLVACHMPPGFPGCGTEA